MTLQKLRDYCIIVEWTQINEQNEYIPDSIGNLYFVPLCKITEGMYQFDPFVYASLLIREIEYERCLCKVISKEIIKIDFQNSDIRPVRENNKILIKHVNSNKKLNISEFLNMSNSSLDKFSNELLEKDSLNENAELDDSYSEESLYKANKNLTKNRVISDDENDSVQSDEHIKKPVKRLRLDVIRSDDDDEEYPDTQISAKKKTKNTKYKNFSLENSLDYSRSDDDKEYLSASISTNIKNVNAKDKNFSKEKIDKSNINESIYYNISCGLKEHISSLTETSKQLTNSLQKSNSQLENGITENNRVKKLLNQQQQKLNPIQEKFVETLVEIKNCVMQQTDVLSNMSINLFQLNEKILSNETKLNDLKVLFKNYRSSTKLFEDDFEISKTTRDVNSKQTPTSEVEENIQVRSVSPKIISNKCQNDIHLNGLSETNRILVKLFASYGVEDVKKLYDIQRDLYNKIKSEFSDKIEDKSMLENLWKKGVKAFSNFKIRNVNEFKIILSKNKKD